MLNLRKDLVREECRNLQEAFTAFSEANARKSDIMEHLELKIDGPPFLEAFHVPEEENNIVQVGKRERAVDPFYLLDWLHLGKDAGIYKRKIEVEFKDIWQTKAERRMEGMNSWRSEMLQERVARFHKVGTMYNASLNQIQAIHMEKDLRVMGGSISSDGENLEVSVLLEQLC